MAEIVGAVGVPHTPHFPLAAEQDDELGAELRRLYGEIATRVVALDPDVILLVTADHYNNFFVSSIPIFSIGVAESVVGPVDYELPRREMPIDAELARGLQTCLVAGGFDVGCSQEFRADHPFTISLNFVVADRSIPIVPLYVSTFLRPIPTAARCFALGRAVREALDRVGGSRRVMVLATGSFSLEIGGPRMSATSHTGVPAPQWTERIMECLHTAQWDALVVEATDEQLADAGNAGGETLLWITMLGALPRPAPPVFLEAQPEWGHAYGAWIVDGDRANA